MPARFYHFKNTSSSQEIAEQLGCSRNWSLVWADRQSDGRGRNDRDWLSEPGGLYYSLRYPADVTSLEPSYQVLTGAFTWIRLLSERWFGSGVLSIKWPNDILLSGRKLGGCLAELSGGMLTMGIGLNVNNRPDDQSDGFDRPVTSLVSELGETVSRRSLLFEWNRIFRTTISQPDNHVPVARLEERIDTMGKRVRCGKREGRAVALSSDGGLTLDNDRERFTVYAHESVEVPQ